MAVYDLMEAVKTGRRDIVSQKLLQGPASMVRGADCNGTTCIILAARLNYEAIVKELLAHGGDPEASEVVEVGGNTALHFAARNKNELASLMLSMAKKRNHTCGSLKDLQVLSRAHRTVNRRLDCQFREMISSLLSFGASPNQQNSLGQTPLHIAARVGCKGAVEQMLAAGANPAITDQCVCMQINADTGDELENRGLATSGFDAAYWADHGKYSDVARLLPPPKSLVSKEIALFQLLSMEQLGLTMKMPSTKKGKGKKKK